MQAFGKSTAVALKFGLLGYPSRGWKQSQRQSQDAQSERGQCATCGDVKYYSSAWLLRLRLWFLGLEYKLLVVSKVNANRYEHTPPVGTHTNVVRAGGTIPDSLTWDFGL